MPGTSGQTVQRRDKNRPQPVTTTSCPYGTLIQKRRLTGEQETNKTSDHCEDADTEHCRHRVYQTGLRFGEYLGESCSEVFHILASDVLHDTVQEVQ